MPESKSWFRGLAHAALLVVLGVTALAEGRSQAPDTAETGEYSGMITDSVCGARHVKHPEMNSANCTRECVRTGAKYTLIDGENVYTLRGNFSDLSQFAGQRAKVTGSLNGDTIQVTAINPM